MSRRPDSYARCPTDEPLLEVPIADVLDEIVARYPDNGALVSIHQGLRYTYREFAGDRKYREEIMREQSIRDLDQTT